MGSMVKIKATLKMDKTLLLALCLCAGLASCQHLFIKNKGDFDVYFYKSTWLAGKDAPSVMLFLQAPVKLANRCRSSKKGCEAILKYRVVYSRDQGSSMPGPWSPERRISVKQIIEARAPFMLENLEPGAEYQVILQDSKGEDTEYFTKTVAHRGDPA